jgi:hypothetical protein
VNGKFCFVYLKFPSHSFAFPFFRVELTVFTTKRQKEGGTCSVRVVGFCLHTQLCRVNIFVGNRVRLQTMIFNTAVPLTGGTFYENGH